MKITALLLFFLASFLTAVCQPKPRVFVYTDINLVGGDPDDRQSMLHLLWYANELDIEGIVPDYWKGKGYEATMEAVDMYEKDYRDYEFGRSAYPTPDSIRKVVAKNQNDARNKLLQACQKSDEALYVLIWGQMTTFRDALQNHPEIADKVRVLTIATGVKYGPRDEEPGEDCQVVNWNGKGRNEIFNDPRFKHMWWIESNWTYNGMFMGEEPAQMFEKLSVYGAMGAHIQTVTKNHDWAHYFRVGDTPTVLYLIDPSHHPDDPESSSWAGLFKKPFPETRPNFYTDHSGSVEWNYSDPCLTWSNSKEMYAYNKSTLLKQRDSMYQSLLKRLGNLYSQ